ncbi:MAG: LON peptidase substrate-binding domain-containing protein, partial [Planctomycetota bacterium]
MLPAGNWVIEVAVDEPEGLDRYLNEESVLYEHNHIGDLPEVIGILPIRNAVVFPGTVTPLAIGRDKSRRLLEDTKPNRSVIGLVAQRDPDNDDPGFGDLYSVGTAATVLKVIRLPQGSMHVVVHGMSRFKISKPVSTEPYLKAKVRPLKVKARMSKKLQALIVSVRQVANRVVTLSPNVPEEKLLEDLDAARRLEKISFALASQVEVLELSHKIQGRVRDSIDKTQREYFLQEQLKAIQSELGQEDRRSEELRELREKIKKAKMPEAVEQEAVRELDRLGKIPPVSPEYSVIRTYLDWVCELPWSIETDDRLDVTGAERILNRDHYDLSKVKKRILEFLAVRKLNPSGKSPILCFVGPPGVGKTSLGRSIARAMSRKFSRISLGG